MGDEAPPDASDGGASGRRCRAKAGARDDIADIRWILGCNILQYTAQGPSVKRLAEAALEASQPELLLRLHIHVAGHGDDRVPWVRHCASNNLQPSQLWHLNVQKHDIGVGACLDKFQSLLTVFQLDHIGSEDPHPTQHSQTHANIRGLIVHKHNLEGRHVYRSCTFPASHCAYPRGHGIVSGRGGV